MARSSRRSKSLAPVHANLGIESAYRKRLDALIAEMDASLLWWLRATWRKNPPVLAQDALPAVDLRRQMQQLSRRWQSRFDEAAPQLADYFATAAVKRADGALQRILDEAGLTVRFRLTRGQRGVYEATIGENVALIKSIAAEHLSAVEGMLMRSVTEGRDLASMAKKLEEQFDATKKRAALIARDQNNKATATITRCRQLELGIQKAIWMHSGAGKHPRPSHVAYSQGRDGGPEYEIEKGAFIDGEWIFPGQLINCRCVSRSIVPGF